MAVHEKEAIAERLAEYPADVIVRKLVTKSTNETVMAQNAYLLCSLDRHEAKFSSIVVDDVSANQRSPMPKSRFTIHAAPSTSGDAFTLSATIDTGDEVDDGRAIEWIRNHMVFPDWRGTVVYCSYLN